MFKPVLKSTMVMPVVTLICAVNFVAATANAQDASRDRVGIAQSNHAKTKASNKKTVDNVTYIKSPTLAQANSATGFVINDTLVEGRQGLGSTVTARSSIQANNIWGDANTSVMAHGNGVTARSDDANIAIDMTQNANQNASVKAVSKIEIPADGQDDEDTPYVGGAVQSVSANTNGLEVSGSGHHYVAMKQVSRGNTDAQANLNAKSAEVEQFKMAVQSAGNSIYANGKNNSMTMPYAVQHQSGNVTSRAQATINNADHGGIAASQAAGNTITSLTNNGTNSVTSRQGNSGRVRAITNLRIDEFANGAVNGQSKAVGNTSLVSAIGGDVHSNTRQNNKGHVTAVTRFTGGVQSDNNLQSGASMSSVAYGNTQTTNICSECSPRLNATIRQNNSGNVTAKTVMSHSGNVTSMTGSAIAVGNVATFSASKP